MSWTFNPFAGRAVGPAAPLPDPLHYIAPRPSPEPVPTRLDTAVRSPHASIGGAGAAALTVAYTGTGARSDDFGVAKADAPVPVRTSDLFYFEVTVTSAGERGRVAVGFLSGDALRRGASRARSATPPPPGWAAGWVWYHGADGARFDDGGTVGEAYGPTFTTGDVVGAGVDWGAGEVFFTKNGQDCGRARATPEPAAALACRLHPAVSLHSPGEAVALNFAGPFRYDVAARAAAAAAAARADVAAAVTTPFPPTQAASTALVREYLLHSGYARTLAALDKATGEEASSPLDASLAARAAARAALAAGDVGTAAAAAAATPGVRSPATVLGAPPAALFLAAQATIEALRAGDVGRAVEVARAGLGPFASVDRSKYASWRTGRALARAAMDSANALAPHLGLASPLRGSSSHAVVPRRQVVFGKVDNMAVVCSDSNDDMSEYSCRSCDEWSCDGDDDGDDAPSQQDFGISRDIALETAKDEDRAAREAAKAMARDVLALAAYDLSPAARPHPAAPPPHLARLLSQAQRDAAADALNSAVLLELEAAARSAAGGGGRRGREFWARPRPGVLPASRLERALRAAGAAAGAVAGARPGPPFSLGAYLPPRPPGGVEARWAPLLADVAVQVASGGGGGGSAPKKKAKTGGGGGGGGGG